jgi:DNA-binding MarR family transcriptional regulator
MAGMPDDQDVRDVLRFYPQIYLACHVDHVRAASTEFKLSAADSSILAHLDVAVPMRPQALAKHLGVAASTLSATLRRLETLGYIANTPVAEDRRRRHLTLTDRGAEAMAATSVLDRQRVRKLLAALPARDRQIAVQGLSLLARAARVMRKEDE